MYMIYVVYICVKLIYWGEDVRQCCRDMYSTPCTFSNFPTHIPTCRASVAFAGQQQIRNDNNKHKQQQSTTENDKRQHNQLQISIVESIRWEWRWGCFVTGNSSWHATQSAVRPPPGHSHTHTETHTVTDRNPSVAPVASFAQVNTKRNEICRAHTNFKYQRASTFFVVASTHTRGAHPIPHPFTPPSPRRTLPIDASQSYAAVVIVPALPAPPLWRSTLHNEATWGPRHAPGSTGSQGNKLLPRSHASAPRTFSLSN